jgi:outer membrane protein OmpA-like peptidoglycan-associated protein
MMFQSLARLLALCGAFAACASAGAQTTVGGKVLDLAFPVQDLAFATENLVFATQNVAYATQDLKFSVENIAGAKQDLAAGTQDLGAKTQDLGAKTQDLGAKTQDLGAKTQPLAAKTPDLEVKETATEIRIELAADVLFDFDKATIRPEAANALHSVAEIIGDKGGGRRVRISGYTDSKGSDAYNQKLSERRAASVKQWLAQKEGLPPAAMTTQGFGARSPVAPNAKPDGSDDPDGRQKNRRVEIVLAK